MSYHRMSQREAMELLKHIGDSSFHGFVAEIVLSDRLYDDFEQHMHDHFVANNMVLGPFGARDHFALCGVIIRRRSSRSDASDPQPGVVPYDFSADQLDS